MTVHSRKECVRETYRVRREIYAHQEEDNLYRYCNIKFIQISRDEFKLHMYSTRDAQNVSLNFQTFLLPLQNNAYFSFLEIDACSNKTLIYTTSIQKSEKGSKSFFFQLKTGMNFYFRGRIMGKYGRRIQRSLYILKKSGKRESLVRERNGPRIKIAQC